MPPIRTTAVQYYVVRWLVHGSELRTWHEFATTSPHHTLAAIEQAMDIPGVVNITIDVEYIAIRSLRL